MQSRSLITSWTRPLIQRGLQALNAGPLIGDPAVFAEPKGAPR